MGPAVLALAQVFALASSAAWTRPANPASDAPEERFTPAAPQPPVASYPAASYPEALLRWRGPDT